MKIVLIMFVLLNISSCDENPVEVKENKEPVIFSLVAFPDVVYPNDSLIVICNAYDPDADTLVYDWITSGSIVRIKGSNHPWLYNTKENSQIFYAPDSQFVSAPQDTFWIQCAARDGKGGQVSEVIKFIVKQNTGGD